MDPLCFDDNREDIEAKSAEGFVTSDVSGVEDKFGDPEVIPRVGDEYQAEIPPLTAAPYVSQLVKKTRDSEITVNMPDSFSLGLPLPLMWAHCEFESSCSCGTLESVTCEEGHVISENECPKVKVELQAALLGEGKNLGGFSNFKSSSKSDETDIDSCPELKTELDQPRDKYLLPGLLSDQSWTDIDYNSFLLGLYVFGKNLNLLKRFVGSRSMGDILSFYYGKFFRSKEYSRWSECRKLKTRRCIYGQKIFTGWRQQELLSRLFSHVPQDCQTTLVEVSLRDSGSLWCIQVIVIHNLGERELACRYASG